jgi:hypothetical protein
MYTSELNVVPFSNPLLLDMINVKSLALVRLPPAVDKA